MTTPVLPRSGEGTIGRLTSWFLTAVFVAFIALPTLLPGTDRNQPGVLTEFPDDLRAEGFQKAVQSLEKRIEEKAGIMVTLREPYRAASFHLFGQTAAGTTLGRDGFLYYRDDLKFALGPGPLSPRQDERLAELLDTRNDAFEDTVRTLLRRLRGVPRAEPRPAPSYVSPATAIRNAVRQFRARGIEMLVVPIPGKLVVYPEYYATDYPVAAGPAENRSMPRWKELLQDDGILVVDLLTPMWQAKGHSDGLLYFKTDSHWTPAGLDVAADVIAARAAELSGPAPPSSFRTQQEIVDYLGDQLPLLGMPGPENLFPR